MCGITGAWCFNEKGYEVMKKIEAATEALHRRGPDSFGIYHHHHVALGHRRLAIIDISASGNQPMQDPTGRYVIVYNGEIYNFKSLRAELMQKGYTFRSNSDTEVLLYLYIEHKEQCLHKLNGFFAFAIYDQQEETLFIARDRMGIKPLLYYKDENLLIFSSEMKSLLAYQVKKQLNYTALYTYLQLNYIPAPLSILNQIYKLLPGHYIKVDTSGNFTIEKYFQIHSPSLPIHQATPDYPTAIDKLRNLLSDSVQQRLIADVPLGTFLSGGVDSSIISLLAARYSPYINTFSIGFRDEPFFDESPYAEMVARKLKTNHTTFLLTNEEMLEHLNDILDYIDEPFADSSAIAVYILSKQTRRKVTVALSGDGGDELFGGYNKHAAEYRARQSLLLNKVIQVFAPFLQYLPQSRNSKMANLFRQLNRYAEGLQHSKADRYWRWCSYISEQQALQLLSAQSKIQLNLPHYTQIKQLYTRLIGNTDDLNDVLYADMHLVLANDMLQKVDLMSMANALEVRVPFLDYRIVNFMFSLPASYKIDKRRRKKILIDAFRNDLPEQIFTRPKHGFEVPLLKWFRNELFSMIHHDLLDDQFVASQQLFDLQAVKRLKQLIMSGSPSEAQARVWGLIVFQYWWKKYFC